MRLHSAIAGTLLVACAGTPPNDEVAKATSVASAAPSPETTPTADGRAHALVLQAAACWFGGLWSDAQGVDANTRAAFDEKRCVALANKIAGHEDRPTYDWLRELEPKTIDKLRGMIASAASGDKVDAPRKDALLKLFDALVAAQRENNDAHDAASAVKKDVAGAIDRDTLNADEVAAVKPLRARAGLEALYKLDAGDLSGEARLMALFCAMDRMQLARGLTKHLKVYAVSEPFQIVFGVAPPSVPSDATAKLTPGLWLGYLTDVAKAAGHAVPDTATSPREREPWAWGGVIEGFADRVRAETPKLAPSDLKDVAQSVVARIDKEWAEVPALAADQKKMADVEAKQKQPPPNPKKK